MSKSVVAIQRIVARTLSRGIPIHSVATCSLLLLVVSLLTLPEQTMAADQPGLCSKVEVAEKRDGSAAIYAIDATTSFVTNHDNTLNRSDDDFGRRLMLFKKEGDTEKRLYYSTGSGDSYMLEPTFFSNCGGYDLLILAEIGTEYSWGLRVFTYRDGEVSDLGYIPLALDVEDDIFDDSVIPHIIFRHDGPTLVISFDGNVVRNPGGLDEKQYAADAIEYRIVAGRLEERIRDDIQE